MKVLVKVPTSAFVAVPDDVDSCQINKPAEGYFKAPISVYTYKEQIDFIIDAIESYVPFMARSSTFITNINIPAELKRLKLAVDTINRYLSINFINQDPSRYSDCDPLIDKILLIGYAYDYTVAFALVDDDQHTIGYDCFINHEVLNHLTTANYLINLEKMFNELSNRDPNNFDIFAFLTKYTLPTVVIGTKEIMSDGTAIYSEDGTSAGFADLAKILSLELNINLCKSKEELAAEENHIFDAATRRNLKRSQDQLSTFKGDNRLSAPNVQALRTKFKVLSAGGRAAFPVIEPATERKKKNIGISDLWIDEMGKLWTHVGEEGYGAPGVVFGKPLNTEDPERNDPAIPEEALILRSMLSEYRDYAGADNPGKAALKVLYNDVLSKIDLGCVINEALQCYLERTIQLVGEQVTDGDSDLGEVINASITLGKMVDAQCGFNKCNGSPDIDMALGLPIFQGIRIPDYFPTLDFLADAMNQALEQLYAALVNALASAILRILTNSCQLIFDDILGEGTASASIKDGFQEWAGESIGIDLSGCADLEDAEREICEAEVWKNALTGAGGSGFVGVIGNYVSRMVAAGQAAYQDTGVSLNLPIPPDIENYQDGWKVEERYVTPEAIRDFLMWTRSATEDVNAVTSATEQMALAKGTAAEETKEIAYKCIQKRNPDYAALFRNKYEFTDLLAAIGRMIDPKFLELTPGPEQSTPPDFCTLGDGSDARALRSSILADKDPELDDEAINEIINKEVEHNTKKLIEIRQQLDAVLNGKLAPDMPPIFGTKNSLIPSTPKVIDDVIRAASQGVFSPVKFNFDHVGRYYPQLWNQNLWEFPNPDRTVNFLDGSTRIGLPENWVVGGFLRAYEDTFIPDEPPGGDPPNLLLENSRWPAAPIYTPTNVFNLIPASTIWIFANPYPSSNRLYGNADVERLVTVSTSTTNGGTNSGGYNADGSYTRIYTDNTSGVRPGNLSAAYNHIHEFTVDANGNGSTLPGGDNLHSHQISNSVVLDEIVTSDWIDNNNPGTNYSATHNHVIGEETLSGANIGSPPRRGSDPGWKLGYILPGVEDISTLQVMADGYPKYYPDPPSGPSPEPIAWIKDGKRGQSHSIDGDSYTFKGHGWMSFAHYHNHFDVGGITRHWGCWGCNAAQVVVSSNWSWSDPHWEGADDWVVGAILQDLGLGAYDADTGDFESSVPIYYDDEGKLGKNWIYNRVEGAVDNAWTPDEWLRIKFLSVASSKAIANKASPVSPYSETNVDENIDERLFKPIATHWYPWNDDPNEYMTMTWARGSHSDTLLRFEIVSWGEPLEGPVRPPGWTENLLQVYNNMAGRLADAEERVIVQQSDYAIGNRATNMSDHLVGDGAAVLATEFSTSIDKEILQGTIFTAYDKGNSIFPSLINQDTDGDGSVDSDISTSHTIDEGVYSSLLTKITNICTNGFGGYLNQSYLGYDKSTWGNPAGLNPSGDASNQKYEYAEDAGATDADGNALKAYAFSKYDQGVTTENLNADLLFDDIMQWFVHHVADSDFFSGSFSLGQYATPAVEFGKRGHWEVASKFDTIDLPLADLLGFENLAQDTADLSSKILSLSVQSEMQPKPSAYELGGGSTEDELLAIDATKADIEELKQQEPYCDDLSSNRRSSSITSVILLVRTFIIERALLGIQVFDSFDISFMNSEMFINSIYSAIDSELEKWRESFPAYGGSILEDVQDVALQYYKILEVTGDDTKTFTSGTNEENGKSALISIIAEEIDSLKTPIEKGLKLPSWSRLSVITAMGGGRSGVLSAERLNRRFTARQLVRSHPWDSFLTDHVFGLVDLDVHPPGYALAGTPSNASQFLQKDTIVGMPSINIVGDWTTEIQPEIDKLPYFHPQRKSRPSFVFGKVKLEDYQENDSANYGTTQKSNVYEIRLYLVKPTLTISPDMGGGTGGLFATLQSTNIHEVFRVRCEHDLAKTTMPQGGDKYDQPTTGEENEIWANLKQQLWNSDEYRALFYGLYPIKEMVASMSIYQYAALTDTAVFPGEVAGIRLGDMLSKTKLAILQTLASSIYGGGKTVYKDPFLAEAGLNTTF